VRLRQMISGWTPDGRFKGGKCCSFGHVEREAFQGLPVPLLSSDTALLRPLRLNSLNVTSMHAGSRSGPGFDQF